MKAWHWLLVGVAGWLMVGGLLWVATKNLRHLAEANAKRAAVERTENDAPLPKGRPFTRVETNTFLDAAQRAEKIADPLQRCLAYPDPPGSHWDHEVVVAYCKYHNQPTITFAQVQQMIQAGRGRELDQVFDAALRAQMTDPDARGRLDRLFVKDFGDATFELRSTLDAWKRQSPNSAFAYAASGVEYKTMAAEARGDNYISKTPQSAIDSMNRLARSADADLKHAVALNPKITPAYDAMITIGAMSLGDEYALSAAKRGLAQDPGNTEIYGRLMWLEQPNWAGSLDAMTAVANGARKYEGRNPLVRALITGRDMYRIESCDCAADAKLSAYESVLDQFSWADDLKNAGYAAKDASNPSAMAIYLSEALRFSPELHNTRIDRTYALVEFDRIPWAIAEASRLIAADPNDEYSIRARAWAYSIGNDPAHAQQDFEMAARLDPDDDWVRTQLSGAYMGNKQWDKAWDLANREIEKKPQDMGGWSLRAAIQEQQPRAGLKATADYLESHFYTDKKNLQFNAYIAHLQTLAQRRAGTFAGHAGASASVPHG
jgi:uncharacterized protein DUF4034